MTRFLLDTNILSELVRDPHGSVAERIRSVGERRVLTSVVVSAELRYGAARRGSKRLTRQLDAILGALEVAPLEPPVDRVYGEARTRLERLGTPIGGNDLLLASHALSLGCTLVTANEREFGRVAGLTTVNWLEDG